MELHKPIRALHSFRSFVKGGIETWLMNIIRLHSSEIQFDFYLNDLGGSYETEAREYGCQIYKAPPIHQLNNYNKALENILKKNKYDVYHCHVEEFAGDSVKIATKAGVPVRIGHSHNTVLARGKTGFEMQIRSWRFKSVNRMRMLRNATDILACSNDAGRYFMGWHWKNDVRCKTLYCGVPVESFRYAFSKWTKNEFRRMHGISESAIVIGHAGSMGPTFVKNHLFILKIFAELAKRDQRYYLYLAGDGPHRSLLKSQIIEMGLHERILIPGPFDDIPSLMVHGFDVHLLPSLFEGLPIVGLEAVGSGLYTICSNTITKDFTGYFPNRVTTVALDAHPAIWADKVEEGIRKKISVDEGISIIKTSPFSITSSLENLIRVYQRRDS